MNTHKKAGVLCIVLSLCVLGLWFAKGAHLATPQQIQVEKVTVDPDFGEKVITKEWVDNDDITEIGLDYAGPAMGALGGLGVLLFFLGIKKES